MSTSPLTWSIESKTWTCTQPNCGPKPNLDMYAVGATIQLSLVKNRQSESYSCFTQNWRPFASKSTSISLAPKLLDFDWWRIFYTELLKIVGMQTRPVQFRQLLHSKRSTVKKKKKKKKFFGWWCNVFFDIVDLWLQKQQRFNHGLFTWIIHDSAKTCSKLSQIHVNNPWFSQDLFEVVSDPQSKASTSLSAAAFACMVQLYSYGSVWN